MAHFGDLKQVDEKILWKQLYIVICESLASTRDSFISITTMSKCPQPRQQHQKWLRILYSVLTSNNFTFESFALQKTFQYFSSSLRFFLSACYYFFPFLFSSRLCTICATSPSHAIFDLFLFLLPIQQFASFL